MRKKIPTGEFFAKQLLFAGNANVVVVGNVVIAVAMVVVVVAVAMVVVVVAVAMVVGNVVVTC